MHTIETDVLIIGTGFGAAAPALRLAEAGMRVTAIEKGPHIDPAKDLQQTQDPQYALKYLKSMGGKNLGLTYAEALGGGSPFYEMVSLRAPSHAFEQTDDLGNRLWPRGVDRASLDPFYDVADQMLRVEQIAPHHVPKSGLVFAMMMKNLGYTCERARYAVQGCFGCGFCVTGCIYSAKQSLLLNYLPMAEAAGARIETDLEAEAIDTLDIAEWVQPHGAIASLPYRYLVRCRRRTGSQEHIQFRAKILILGGGTVGTAKLLLRSRESLSRLSPHVGRNIAFNGSVKTAGLLPPSFPDADMFSGRSHPGVISYQFLDSHGISITVGKPMPLQVIASARLRLDGDERQPTFWGTPHVELMKQFRHRVIVLVAFGMTPPLGWMSHRGGDRFDLHLDGRDRLERYYKETKGLLHSIMHRNGCRVIHADFVNKEGVPHDDLHFSTAHQVGSCRMSDSKSTGVIDSMGEVFDYPGMYVTDGAAIPTSLAVNTAHTILANAERVAVSIVERHSVKREQIVASQLR